MSELTHLNADGQIEMVDVGAKQITDRTAVAGGQIVMKAETFRLIRDGNIKKGDVLTTAKIAGIMAAKKTSEIIPLCHPIDLSYIDLTMTLDETLPGITVTATAKTTGQTGVEMEALTAVNAACLTVYDMAKAVDREMRISEIRLLEKRGGKSGHFIADGYTPSDT